MGRLKLHIEALDNKIPSSYGEFAVSIEKMIITKYSEEFFHSLYKYGDRSNKRIKDINSAIYVEDFLKDKDILKAKKFNFYLSSYNEEFFQKLVYGALKLRDFSYKEFRFKVLRVELLEERKINNDYVLLKTMSPLVVRNKLGKFLNIEDEEYEKVLNYIVNIELITIRGYGLAKPLKFIPLNMKKVVLKEKIRDFTVRQYFYINAYKGEFILRGDKEDLNVIYKMGVGNRRSQAKGMVDIV